MKSTSKFSNISEALVALRKRTLVPFRDSITETTEVMQPSLSEDKELVREIMKLGVDLYKVERNIQD